MTAGTGTGDARMRMMVDAASAPCEAAHSTWTSVTLPSALSRKRAETNQMTTSNCFRLISPRSRRPHGEAALRNCQLDARATRKSCRQQPCTHVYAAALNMLATASLVAGLHRSRADVTAAIGDENSTPPASNMTPRILAGTGVEEDENRIMRAVQRRPAVTSI